MIRYTLVRLALLVVGLVVASVIIFAALRILPGDVAQLIAGVGGSPEQVAALREELGLNEPVWAQYLAWAGGVLRGDLGTSLITGTPVVDQLVEKAAITLPLGILALVIALAVAVPFGIVAGVRRGRAAGTAVSLVSQLVAAVPVVWAGMMLVVFFAVALGWLPAQGFPRAGWGDPVAAVRALLLPAITIGLVEGALLLRFVRSATIEAAGQDFVRTAAAKGLTRSQALIRQGLPTVGLSVVTVLGLQVAGIIVGAVVIEQLFGLPGIGRMLVEDVGRRDLPKVQGELLALTGFVLIVGFVVDLVHRLLDPRLREADA